MTKNLKLFFLNGFLFILSASLFAERSPAPAYCVANSGTYEVRNSPGGQYGVCIWEEYIDTINDGCYLLHSECGAWDFYNGLCQKRDCQEIGYELNENGEWNRVCTQHAPRLNSDDFNISNIFGIKFFISFEEGFESGSVFRPAGYNFPPSHPRSGFKFDQNGQYTFYEPRYDDGGVVAVSGAWIQVSSDTFEIYKNNRLESVVELRGGQEKIIRRQIQ